MISVVGVSKKFKYWSDRPQSLKTALVSLTKGKKEKAHWEEFWALQNISLEVKAGEFIGIMGRNGSGKSTLLKLIAGIYQPTLGTIHTHGRLAPLIELGAGFHPELTGYENLFLLASILGLGKRETEAAAPAILEFAELGDLIHMPIRKFSTGMLVRLGFSIATHLNARVLLVDEVLAVGDKNFQDKCLKRILELRAGGCAIVLVTHDPQAVLDHCERAIVIDRHEKIHDGSPQEAVATYLRVVNETDSIGNERSHAGDDSTSVRQ